MLEEYDVGEQPGPPSTFEASLDGNTLNITVGEGSQTFDITAPIARPAGAPSGPIARMGAEAARIDALAAREVWTALGVPHRMGASEENVNHCVWHDGFTPDLEAYLDKFLLGNEDVNTDILRSKFTDIDTETWIPWETPTLE